MKRKAWLPSTKAMRAFCKTDTATATYTFLKKTADPFFSILDRTANEVLNKRLIIFFIAIKFFFIISSYKKRKEAHKHTKKLLSIKSASHTDSFVLNDKKSLIFA